MTGVDFREQHGVDLDRDACLRHLLDALQLVFDQDFGGLPTGVDAPVPHDSRVDPGEHVRVDVVDRHRECVDVCSFQLLFSLALLSFCAVL